MPTLLRRAGFKFFFYANEHLPRHIHVTYADKWAEIELGMLLVVSSTMKSQELTRCLAIVRQYNSTFEEKWDERFNQR